MFLVPMGPTRALLPPEAEPEALAHQPGCESGAVLTEDLGEAGTPCPPSHPGAGGNYVSQPGDKLWDTVWNSATWNTGSRWVRSGMEKGRRGRGTRPTYTHLMGTASWRPVRHHVAGRDQAPRSCQSNGKVDIRFTNTARGGERATGLCLLAP